MEFDIIDFHTHPFLTDDENICAHIPYCDMSPKGTFDIMRGLNISKICGSVIIKRTAAKPEWSVWDKLEAANEIALKLRELYGDFYEPGFHVHPDYVTESCERIEKMHKAGYRLIGELVPYMDGWKDYSVKGFDEILDLAEQYSMVVSFHSSGLDGIDEMVKRHPRVTLVAAHPGEADQFERHLARMKMSENYCLDLSGTGLFRYGVLRHGVKLFGTERFVFGSDYPSSNPAMFVGGVALDCGLSDNEKEMIFSLNAKRLMGF